MKSEDNAFVLFPFCVFCERHAALLIAAVLKRVHLQRVIDRAFKVIQHDLGLRRHR